jgi:hypothetical protein
VCLFGVLIAFHGIEKLIGLVVDSRDVCRGDSRPLLYVPQCVWRSQRPQPSTATVNRSQRNGLLRRICGQAVRRPPLAEYSLSADEARSVTGLLNSR